MLSTSNFTLFCNIKCCFVCSMRSFFDFVKKLDGESEPGIRPGGVPVYTLPLTISPILPSKPALALTLLLISHLTLNSKLINNKSSTTKLKHSFSHYLTLTPNYILKFLFNLISKLTAITILIFYPTLILNL